MDDLSCRRAVIGGCLICGVSEQWLPSRLRFYPKIKVSGLSVWLLNGSGSSNDGD